MELKHALFVGKVMHARSGAANNRFTYSIYNLCLRLSDLPKLDQLRLFSRNRFNLFSIRETDYGFHAPEPTLQSAIDSVLERHGLRALCDGDTWLLTMPRVLGYAFNPVSFWFCLDSVGQLRAVFSEVNNTFGERHGYLCFHPDHHPIGPDEWLESDKVFHVSPFFEVRGNYRFRFAYQAERLGIWIDYHVDGARVFTSSLTGKRLSLSDASLLRCFTRYPLVTFMVVGRIHWQAVKLMAKGARWRSKPPPPLEEITL